MTSLLVQADDLLRGAITIPSESLRGACWLGRAALEETVRQQLEDAGHPVGTASMRSMLACLESATGLSTPQLARDAKYAWIGLSQAAHHHAYELAPTVAEVRHLLGLVARVASTTA